MLTTFNAALKYHPDRNPGKEAEVNSKFQVIQAAHEVLSDPTQKAKYDSTLGRSTNRYPGASGVRGNPWANVGQQFPTPPRRAPAGSRNTTSGAQRWQTRFSSGVPPTAKQAHSADSEAKKNAAKAFENMRKTSQRENRAAQPPPPPPRNPPRTESARQRAEASFGARKSGYYPRSTMPGDEPPVANQNYSSRSEGVRTDGPPPPQRKPVPAPMPDPLSQFRDKDQRAPTDDTHRSSSVPRPQGYETDDRNARVPADERPHSAYESSGTHNGTSFKSRASARRTAQDGQPSDSQASNDKQDDGKGPSMYGAPKNNYDSPYHYQQLVAPSGMPPSSASATPTPFEKQQTFLLNTLINNKKAIMCPQDGNSYNQNTSSSEARSLQDQPANVIYPNSFSFPVDNDTFENSAPQPDGHSFSKSSLDDINTSFVNDDGQNKWQFNAGTGEADVNVGSRSSFGGGRANRRTPIKRPTMPPDANANPVSNVRQTESGFNPEGWSDKFGPQTFVPPAPPGPSASPGRTSRANSKKSKVKPTTGTAAVVEDISSEDDLYAWRGRNAQTKPSMAESPQAMDIDSPSSSSNVPPAQSARNIPVEPSREEWRAGDGIQKDSKPERPAKIPLDANAAGSEDSEEFRASFAELKNVAPFSQQQDGLNDVSGLRDNLPFESKASDVPPVKLPKPHPLAFPPAPTAPPLPPAVAIGTLKPNTASWQKYLADFEAYLKQWESFNAQVVDHFATRKSLIADTRVNKGYGFLGARADTEIEEYYSWVQQDNDVRRRWTDACEDHEKRLREFMAFREKMK